MVLDLLIAQESSASLCVSDLCLSSAVPPTTALRHIASLERNGIIIRSPHPDDARSSIFTLHETAYSQVASFLLSVAMRE